jgi:predicted nucleotidyltransferase
MDALKEFVGSEARARVLAHFVAHPDWNLHVRAMERHVGIGGRSLQLELERLEQMRLLRREQRERKVVYRRAGSTAVWRAIEVMVCSLAPLTLLSDALGGVPGIEAAFVFGSFAAGTAREDSDIDVFVFGDQIAEDEFGKALSTLYMTLDRPLDVKRYDSRGFVRDLREGSSFLPAALEGTQSWLVGSRDALPDSPSGTAV